MCSWSGHFGFAASGGGESALAADLEGEDASDDGVPEHVAAVGEGLVGSPIVCCSTG